MRGLIFMILLFTAGCTDNITSTAPVVTTGNIEITVSYYFNNFVGYKPDVSAKAYLFHADNMNIYADSLKYSRSGIATNTDGDKIDSDYSNEADVNGLIRFNDLSAGRYFIIISSNGRYAYSYKYIDIEKGKTLLLVKNFTMYREYANGGQEW